MSRILFATSFCDVTGGYSTEGLLETHEGKAAALLTFCVQLCAANIRCLSIFYNHSLRKCLLNAAVLFHSKSKLFVAEEGWQYYRTSGDIRCDTSKGFIHNRELNMCYSPEISQATRSQAATHCNDSNGHLVRVDSAARQQHLQKTILSMPLNYSTAVLSRSVTYAGCWERTGTNGCTMEMSSIILITFVSSCAARCRSVGKNYAFLDAPFCYCCDTVNPTTQASDLFCGLPCQLGWGPCNGVTSAHGPLYKLESIPYGHTVDFYTALIKVSSGWEWTVGNKVPRFMAFNDTISGSCAVMSSAYNFRWRSFSCISKAGFICEIKLN